MRADFSGYATKANLVCSDGLTILPNAFQHQDDKVVPLVWQHGHSDAKNVLGKVRLEHREDGVYAHAFFNDTEPGQHAKKLVQHGDVVDLSIYANKLVKRSKEVLHGMIREVSLVLSGANPGARIDPVSIAHGDGDFEVLDDEYIIQTGLGIEVDTETDEEVDSEEETDEVSDAEDVSHADDEDETIQDVLDTMTDKQKDVVEFLLEKVAEEAAEKSPVSHSDSSEEDNNPEGDLKHQEGSEEMTRNIFEQNGLVEDGSAPSATLSHSQIQTIMEDAKKTGSLKESFLSHAVEYGIEDINLLFPDAKSVQNQPDLIARRTEWVKGIIDGAKHSPFARVKSLAFDLTAEEARAKGYVKGNLKKDEIIKLLKRVTTPKMVYKKQKLDREDIIDITELDVVAFLRWEMRFMLEEELARSILIGDGREPDDEDKIDEDHLRPIAHDVDMYNTTINVPSNTDAKGLIEAVIRARKAYKGTGRPAFYTTDDVITDMLLIKDKVGRDVYDDEEHLARKLRVSALIPVEVMEDQADILGVMVNIADYTIGADKGGETTMFDDFDIDYNQHKYLIETRISGALTKPKSAVTIKRIMGTTVTPDVPTYNAATHTITIPSKTGVVYYNVTDVINEEVVSAGALVITETTDIEARPAAGYTFPHNTDNDWTYAYTA